ncbi:hypothetical protein V6N12_006094 [Hibiscus sabdariffa]|uniref:Uncharacterized protein n=1 Tax=Hibiscus sabdariffa TaxID=183260 RepID=A0ABR2EWZ7_9ROSI
MLHNCNHKQLVDYLDDLFLCICVPCYQCDMNNGERYEEGCSIKDAENAKTDMIGYVGIPSVRSQAS